MMIDQKIDPNDFDQIAIDQKIGRKRERKMSKINWKIDQKIDQNWLNDG